MRLDLLAAELGSAPTPGPRKEFFSQTTVPNRHVKADFTRDGGPQPEGMSMTNIFYASCGDWGDPTIRLCQKISQHNCREIDQDLLFVSVNPAVHLRARGHEVDADFVFLGKIEGKWTARDLNRDKVLCDVYYSAKSPSEPFSVAGLRRIGTAIITKNKT
jgi:hypothetical protein